MLLFRNLKTFWKISSFVAHFPVFTSQKARGSRYAIRMAQRLAVVETTQERSGNHPSRSATISIRSERVAPKRRTSESRSWMNWAGKCPSMQGEIVPTGKQNKKARFIASSGSALEAPLPESLTMISSVKSMTMEEMQTCTKCKQTLPITMFYWRCKTQGIRQYSCKTCCTAQIKQSMHKRIERDPITYRCDMMLLGAKHRAKKNNLEFALTHEHVYKLAQQSNCPISNRPFDWKLAIKSDRRGSHTPDSPTLDRIDPRRGYTNDNVWIISYRMNAIKNDGTPQELAMISQAVNREIISRVCDEF